MRGLFVFCPCFHEYLLVNICYIYVCVCVWFSSVMQRGVWAVLLWPYLLTVSVPLDCREEQGTFSHCTSISQEKLLDRVIQHAELIYRVSEESCSLFVSNADPCPEMNLCLFSTFWPFNRAVVSAGSRHTPNLRFNMCIASGETESHFTLSNTWQ